MNKKPTGRALARFEAGPYIWQEVLEGVREIKAGRGKRVRVQPSRPAASQVERQERCSRSRSYIQRYCVKLRHEFKSSFESYFRPGEVHVTHFLA